MHEAAVNSKGMKATGHGSNTGNDLLASSLAHAAGLRATSVPSELDAREGRLPASLGVAPSNWNSAFPGGEIPVPVSPKMALLNHAVRMIIRDGTLTCLNWRFGRTGTVAWQFKPSMAGGPSLSLQCVLSGSSLIAHGLTLSTAPFL